MELKFDPGFRVIGEYFSKIDSILRVNFEMADSILKFNFEMADSILKINFKNGSQYRVNLTQIISNYSESRVEF